jgi:dedicator of cytokinesis protein 3
MMRISPPLRDTITLRTSLCSTRFTQEAVLMKLLNWVKVPEYELPDILAHFTFVGEMEIVKFLRDIFDALFGILVSATNETGEMDHLVFSALITVLGTVQDRRFSNFQPVLDVYIDEHFAHAAAASHMIRSMNRLLANHSSGETAPQLRAALKVWHYVFKFIARSRELQKKSAAIVTNGGTDISESTFRRDLRTHLTEVNSMMSASTPPSIIGTQTIALQHFTSILPELAKIFSNVELVTIATTFAGSIAASSGKMLVWKLIMYLQLVKGFLFEHSHSRSLLVEAVVVWIKPHFGRFDDYAHTGTGDTEAAVDAARIKWLESTRLCVTIIAVMLDKLHQCLIDPEIVGNRALYRREQENVEYILSLLPRCVNVRHE